MIWFSNLIFWVPLSISAIILLWLFYLEIRGVTVSARTAGISLLIIVGINILQFLARSLYLYFALKANGLGQYLLPGKGTNYFYQTIWSFGQPYLWTLAIALGLALILLIIKIIMKSPIVDRADLYLITLTAVVVGSSSVLILILASFFLMFIFQLIYSLRQRKLKTSFRLAMAPFLLIVAFVILILNYFEFYWKFLGLLRLV